MDLFKYPLNIHIVYCIFDGLIHMSPLTNYLEICTVYEKRTVDNIAEAEHIFTGDGVICDSLYSPNFIEISFTKHYFFCKLVSLLITMHVK